VVAPPKFNDDGDDVYNDDDDNDARDEGNNESFNGVFLFFS
jgi:hypothetical protein